MLAWGGGGGGRWSVSPKHKLTKRFDTHAVFSSESKVR